MENLNLENVELKAEEELATVNDLVTLGQVKANYLGKKQVCNKNGCNYAAYIGY